MEKESYLDVSVRRTEDFKSTVLSVSNYLDTLPITAEQNNKPIELIARISRRQSKGLFTLASPLQVLQWLMRLKKIDSRKKRSFGRSLKSMAP